MNRKSKGIDFFFCEEAVRCSWKRWVFSCLLKIVRDLAVRMELIRSFHQQDTVKENVLESEFVPLYNGTTSRCSFTNRRLVEGCWRIGESVSRGCAAYGSSVGKHQWLELDGSRDWKPVQRDEKWCDMVPLGHIKNKMCCCILNHLQRSVCTCWKSSQKSIAIVQPRNDEGLDKKLFLQHDLQRSADHQGSSQDSWPNSVGLLLINLVGL